LHPSRWPGSGTRLRTYRCAEPPDRRAVADGRKGSHRWPRTAARRAIITASLLSGRRSAGLPAKEPNQEPTQADIRRLSSLVKCPLSDTGRRPATPGT
jgi:hypothetical protein